MQDAIKNSDIVPAATSPKQLQHQKGILGGSSVSVGSFVLVPPPDQPDSSLPTRDNTVLLRLLIDSFKSVIQGSVSSKTNRERRSEPSNKVGVPHSDLLTALCKLVSQVCSIDPDAGARLIDVTIKILPVEAASIIPLVSELARQHSIPISQMLPLILPAIAANLGDPQNQYGSTSTSDLTTMLDCIVSQGAATIKELFKMANLLRELLNQIAGIMCLAAKQLNKPLCAARHEHGELTFELIVPCQVGNPSYLSGDKDKDKSVGIGYIRNDAPQGVSSPFSIMPLTGDYSFSSSISNIAISTFQPYQPSPEPLYTNTASQPPSYSTGIAPPPSPPLSDPNGSKSHCTCQGTTSQPPDLHPATETSSMPSKGPCPCQGAGYPCDDCPGGWFCPPKETAAQKVSCGMGWLCYHCKSGTFCAPNALTQVTVPTGGASTSLAATIQTSVAEPSAYNGDNTSAASSSVVPPSPDTTPTSPSSGNQLIDGWTYLGCFKDHGGQVLQGATDEDHKQGTMSSGICTSYCKSKGYKFAAIENGYQCWCGKSLDANQTRLADVACGTVCNGTPTECCGGNDAASIYRCDAGGGIVSVQKYGSLVALLKSDGTDIALNGAI